MITFTGQYDKNKFVYSDDLESIRVQLISILNTPIGSRWYYPSYGSNLNQYRFSPFNYFTINMIGQEIKNAIDHLEGVSLADIAFTFYKEKLIFVISLYRFSDIVKLYITVADGVAS